MAAPIVPHPGMTLDEIKAYNAQQFNNQLPNDDPGNMSLPSDAAVAQQQAEATGTAPSADATAPAAAAPAASDQPVAPEYQSILNPDGTLKDAYKAQVAPSIASGGTLAAGNVAADNVSFKNILAQPAVGFQSILPTASANYQGIIDSMPQGDMTAFRSRALGTDLDPTTRNALDRQRLDELNQLEGAKQTAAGQAAQAAGSLGMRGGLSGGAQERLAGQAAQNDMDAEQNVRRAGDLSRLGIEGNDAQLKASLLENLPAADLAWLQPQMHVADVKTGIAGDERNLGVTTDLANRDYTTGVDKSNSEGGLEADKINAANHLTADTTNAANTMESSRFNILNDQDVAKTNSAAVAAASAADRQNAILGLGGQNAWNANNWMTQMGAWGAGKTADATANAGKHGLMK